MIRKLLFLLLILTGGNCIGSPSLGALDPFHTEELTSPAPSTYWIKPANLTVDTQASTHAAAILPHRPLTLIELTDFALLNSPNTRLAWYQAKAAAANVGIEKSAYLPQVNAGAAGEYSANVFSNHNESLLTYGPNFSLDWLLIDFGHRSNTVLAAEYAQIAANLNQNNAIQQVILQVQQGYYQVLGQQALVKANELNVKQAKTSLDASQALRQNGLATIGDVYQAQSAYAQADLNLQTSIGNYRTALGQLSTILGLPADTNIELAPLHSPLKIDAIEQKVSHLLTEAKINRPDLLAAEAKVRENAAQLAAVKASVLPSISVQAQALPGGVFSNTSGTNVDATLSLSFPLFTGFSYTYQVRQARANLETAEATRDQLYQQVQSQVWQNYYALKTAAENISTTEILLKSSIQANEQAFGQYKNGVGDILSVLTTQTTLANARVQNIQAQLNWYVALAQLAASVGALTNSSVRDPSL